MTCLHLIEHLEAITGLLSGLISILLSQGMGLASQGEKWGNGWLVEQSEHIQHLSIKLHHLIWIWL